MSARLLLLCSDSSKTSALRRALEDAAPEAAVDVCSTPLQLRQRLSADPACQIIAIDDAAAGNALTPLVRHLRAEAHGARIVLLTESAGEDTLARGALAGVDVVATHDERGTGQLLAALTAGDERPRDAAPTPVLVWGASRMMLTTLERSRRIRATPVSTEQAIADDQLRQSSEAMVVMAAVPDEAALLLHRLHSKAARLPVVVLCDEQHRAGFMRLGAAECLPLGVPLDQLELSIERVVLHVRLQAEAAILRSKEGRLRSIVESLPEGVLLADPDGLVQAINRTALELCGVDGSTQVLGRHLSALLGPANEGAVLSIVASIAAGQKSELEVDIAAGANGCHRFDLRAVPFVREGDHRPFILLAMGRASVAPADNEQGEHAAALAQELERERTARREAEHERARAIESLDSSASVWQERAAAAERTAHDLERERGVLHDEIASARARLAELEHISNALRGECDAYAQRMARLEQERGAEDGRRHDELTAVERERDGFRDQLKALRQMLAEAEQRQGVMAAQLDTERFRVAELDSRHVEIQGALANARANLAELKQQRDELIQERDAQRGRVQALDQERNALQGALETAESRLAELAHERESLTGQHGEERERRLAAERERDAYGDELRALRTKAAAMEQRHTALAAECERQERRAGELEEQQAAARNALAAAESRLSEFSGQFEALVQDRDAQRGRVRELEAQQAATQNALAAAESRVSELAGQLDAVSQDRDNSDGRLHVLEEERNALKEAVAAMQAQVDGLAGQRDSLAGQHGHEQEQRAAAERERDELRERMEAIGARCAALEQERGELAAQYEAERLRAGAIAAQREMLAEEHRRREEQHDALQEAPAAADAKLAGLVHERDAAALDRDAQHQRFRELEGERNALQDAMAEARTQLAELTRQAAMQAEEGAMMRQRSADELARQERDLQAAREELETLRQAHAAACEAYIGARRSQTAIEAEIGGLRAQLAESRALVEHATADAARARQTRDDWQLQAQSATDRCEAAEAELRDRALALVPAEPGGELEWLLGVSGIGIVTTASDGRLERCNDAAAQICGWSGAGDALASGCLPGALAAAAGGHDAHAHARHFETWVEGLDGVLRWVLGVAVARRTSGASRVEWMLVDLTRQHAEQWPAASLLRMDTLTHLLASATSECLTQLGQVRRTLDGLSGHNLPGLQPDSLDASRRALARSRIVLKQLGSSAQNGARRPVVFDLAVALEQAMPLLARLAGDEVACDVTPPVPGLLVAADPAEIEQLLTALVLSARECLPAGGRILLSGAAVTIDGSRVGATISRPSVVVRLVASGYGVQPVVWQQASDIAAQLGGRAETRHDAAGSSTIEVVLPRALRLGGPVRVDGAPAAPDIVASTR